MAAPTHIAHFNWAALRAPFGSPVVAEFVEAIERVNALAERCEGFVWREEDDEAAHCRAIGWPIFDDESVIASFSVWETPEALHNFVYKTVHGAFYRRGDAWFQTDGPRNFVLWNVPAGHIPDVAEARDRADTLLADGPTDYAFTFDYLRDRGELTVS